MDENINQIEENHEEDEKKVLAMVYFENGLYNYHFKHMPQMEAMLVISMLERIKLKLMPYAFPEHNENGEEMGDGV